jgi:hypothetical protein
MEDKENNPTNKDFMNGWGFLIALVIGVTLLLVAFKLLMIYI